LAPLGEYNSSVCGGDATFLSNYFDHLFLFQTLAVGRRKLILLSSLLNLQCIIEIILNAHLPQDFRIP